jgi:hypothetical protein
MEAIDGLLSPTQHFEQLRIDIPVRMRRPARARLAGQLQRDAKESPRQGFVVRNTQPIELVARKKCFWALYRRARRQLQQSLY